MKRTLLDKWNFEKALIDEKTKDFVSSQISEIPSVFYHVTPYGEVDKCELIEINYTHFRNIDMGFRGKNPKAEDVARIQKYLADGIPFNREHIFFSCKYAWGKEKTKFCTSSFSIDTVRKSFLNEFDAQNFARPISDAIKAKNDFLELHKKDSSYNYRDNGYKFLGWQNSWKHAYLDKDGNVTEDKDKRKCFTYLTKDHKEFGQCRDLKHNTIEVSHLRSGSENTVSCPVCKIYWKYDCS